MRSSEKIRSKSRIGADTARVWARELVLGNPYAKSILLALANYMNEDGAAWPGIATLARDTDISEDTVVTRLRWLESIGAIALFKCWADEHGRRNYEGRGRVTSSEVRFLFDAEVEAIEVAAKGSAKPTVLRGAAAQSHASKAEISPRPQRELNESQEQGVSPGVAPEQPPPVSARTVELEDIPPKGPPLESEAAEVEPVKTGIAYEQFTEAYGEGSVRPERARALWSALDESERDLAIRGARGYRSQRLATKKSLIDPERFLRSRELWTEFTAAPAVASAARVLVDIETDAGRAWISLHRIGGVPAPSPMISGGKSIMALAADVPVQVLALKRSPQEREWSVVEPGTQEIGAWREFVFAQTGKMPIPQRHTTGERFQPGPDGKPIFTGHDHRHGLKVPAPFPPRVDGSWPEVDSNSALQKAG